MRLLELLSVCHTVQVNESSKEKYQASSPDEFCFVEFCNRLNIIFEGDKKGANRSGGGGGGSANKIREVNFQSRTRRYEIMQVLDFDSTRKRMSIILKNLDTGKYTLFCKGADSAVLRKCVSGDIQGAETAIKEFAHSGWRTLALSYRDLSQAEYANCERLLQDAYNDFMDRNRRIADAFEEIESKLILLGTTAIEDKLQEDVAETLETLRAAGIKVWVLTGDKLETAINISQSCKHFSDAMFKFILTGMKEENQISRNLDSFYQRYAIL
jgi:phospholipid-translocating ATPase